MFGIGSESGIRRRALGGTRINQDDRYDALDTGILRWRETVTEDTEFFVNMATPYDVTIEPLYLAYSLKIFD